MSGVRLRRVNHDTSWLITFPTDLSYPTSTFNLLIDPWLDESEQVDYHASFSAQKRTSPALVSSIIGLEDMLVSEVKEQEGTATDGRSKSKQIDAILISHEFTDHMHPATLQESNVPSRIPFLVTSDSKAALESLLGGRKDYKRTICLIDQANHETASAFCNQRELNILPCNVDIQQIQPRERFSLLSGAVKFAWPKLHGGILLLWRPSYPPNSSIPSTTHTMVYSPHGISPTSIPTWLHSGASNVMQNEAIITSLDKITLPKWLSGIVNLGLSSAIDLITQDVYNASRILATHEERKEATGVVAHLMKRYWLSLEIPDAQTDGLTKLKQRDEQRQVKAQSIVDATLQPLNKKVLVLVLDINEPLIL